MSFRMNEFETYENYVALKLHFTSEYDYFRYNGKTSVTLNSGSLKDFYSFSLTDQDNYFVSQSMVTIQHYLV